MRLTTATSMLAPMKCLFLAPFLLSVAVAVFSPCQVNAAETSVTDRAAIYDKTLDGAKQIEDALTTAKKENKRVLLQFGANWCGWCHLLHDLFETDTAIRDELKGNYVVVLIDVDGGHNRATDTKYGDPMQFGLPVIVILDSEGKQLTTKDTGELVPQLVDFEGWIVWQRPGKFSVSGH